MSPIIFEHVSLLRMHALDKLAKKYNKIFQLYLNNVATLHCKTHSSCFWQIEIDIPIFFISRQVQPQNTHN